MTDLKAAVCQIQAELGHIYILSDAQAFAWDCAALQVSKFDDVAQVSDADACELFVSLVFFVLIDHVKREIEEVVGIVNVDIFFSVGAHMQATLDDRSRDLFDHIESEVQAYFHAIFNFEELLFVAFQRRGKNLAARTKNQSSINVGEINKYFLQKRSFWCHYILLVDIDI